MRLMEILDEARVIEESEQMDDEVLKTLHENYYTLNEGMAENIAISLKAKKGKISWTEKTREIAMSLNKIWSDGTKADLDKLLKKPKEGVIAVEIMKALKTAHGGFKRLLTKIIKSKMFNKKTVQTTIDYVDALENT